MATDTTTIEPATFRAGDTIEWKPRCWVWVDPLKDTQAEVIQPRHSGSGR